ncbi:MAG: hypothetical protein FJ029_07465 [Actinobacteria bacterium]|nr:hypothetical protein [Actinomycetota bacterium]
MRFGSGAHTYELVQGWHKLPPQWTLGWIGSIGTDSQDRVYCFNRGTHPMVVFDRDGHVVDRWGDAWVNHAHGVFVDQREHLWLTDRFAQVVWVATTGGVVLRKLGFPNVTSDQRGLFNHPTNTYVAADGTIFVSDGYGAARCHRFAPSGRLELTWGSPGDGPGQFKLPHGIWALPDGRVLVADRENNRIQVFTRDGVWLATWPDFLQPSDFYVDSPACAIYVAELGGRVTILDFDGKIVARWGERGPGPGQFKCPHGIWVDRHGAIYIGEVQRDDALFKFVPVH